MDFGTIKKKLNQNAYKDVKDFLSDMSQVFINCKLYNGIESFVGKIGMDVRREYDRLLSTYNFVERFQNIQKVHDSMLLIQSLHQPTMEEVIPKPLETIQQNFTDQQVDLPKISEVTNGNSNLHLETNTTLNQDVTEFAIPNKIEPVVNISTKNDSDTFPKVKTGIEAMNQNHVANTIQMENQNGTNKINETVQNASPCPQNQIQIENPTSVPFIFKKDIKINQDNEIKDKIQAENVNGQKVSQDIPSNLILEKSETNKITPDLHKDSVNESEDSLMDIEDKSNHQQSKIGSSENL